MPERDPDEVLGLLLDKFVELAERDPAAARACIARLTMLLALDAARQPRPVVLDLV